MKRLYLIAILSLMGISEDSFAVSIGGITLPETRGELKLQGAGLLKKGLFFRIYVGALYIENETHLEDILKDVPKRIDIHYFHHTPKKYMIRAADDTLKKNLTAQQYNAFLPEIMKLHDAYLDGSRGSFASLVFKPGEGLTYLFDDKVVATIACDDFANVYFKVWLGDQPSSRSVKNAMLEPIQGRRG